ncbi:hypothetical protein BDD12DRAFT_872043 [Trichophaea hybrida]|nr:hypothetical protein BDD12DRAFT_872043 [Trichophaea hybrida]
MPKEPIKQGYKVSPLASQQGYTWDWQFSSPSVGITELDPTPPLSPTQNVVYRMALILPFRLIQSPDAGTPPPSLQPVETPAAEALEEGGEGNGLESGQVSAGADI